MKRSETLIKGNTRGCPLQSGKRNQEPRADMLTIASEATHLASPEGDMAGVDDILDEGVEPDVRCSKCTKICSVRHGERRLTTSVSVEESVQTKRL